MAIMSSPAIERRTVQVQLDADDYEKLAMMPWFSFKVRLPERPLPPISERPHMKTKRLVVRPILISDLEAFHDLRRRPETQNHSTTRGRPDRDIAETKRYIKWLVADDQSHWYFGAFLASTGELIGEGGLPDCLDMPRSGWPEAEFLLKQEFWRQGYGTEFWQAVMNSWWDIPRDIRRHQLLPTIVPDKEPGDEVMEGVGFIWEGSNIAARNFFAKMAGQSWAAVSGTLDTIDVREGREGGIVSWAGTVVGNPHELELDCSQLELGY